MTLATATPGSNDDVLVDKPNATLSPTISSSSSMTSQKQEPCLLEESVELKGVEDVLAALTPEEKAELADENMPLRHFRAEKGNTKEAIRKIKATIAWRKEFQVEKLKRCFDEDGDEEFRSIITKENETGKIYVRGHDKEGRSCMYMIPARENTHDELNNMRHLVFMLEKAIACNEDGLEKIHLIIDYNGFKIKDSPPLSTSKHTLTILQDHYPERMKVSWVCNPPMTFKIFWTIIKPFVDPVTKEKIVFCHGKSGQAKLAKTFDLTKMEKCAFGTETLKEFNSKEFLALPFDKTFE